MYYIKFKEKYARWLTPLNVMWVSDVIDPIDFSIHTKAEAIAEGYHPIARAPQSWRYIYIEEDK